MFCFLPILLSLSSVLPGAEPTVSGIMGLSYHLSGKPGWLACMAGDFLTQFYLYHFMGATILTLCILLAGHNIKCAVRKADIKGTWLPNIVAFAVMTLLVCFSFDYDYRLSSILAIAGGASVFCVSTTILTSTRKLIQR